MGIAEFMEKVGEKIPHPYVLILGVMLLASVATYVVPAGQYARVEDPETGRMAVEPGSYEQVDQQPVGPGQIAMSFINGFIQSANIIVLVFVAGGSIWTIRSTGAIKGGLAWAIERVGGTNKEYLILAGIPLFFGILGGTIGTYESVIVFIPILVMLSLSLGYDAVVGLSLGLLGVAAGFASAPLNPFTVGIAQSIAGLPAFSGMWYRWIFWGVSMTVTIGYIIWYARRVKKDPSKSVVSDIDYSEYEMDEDPTEIELTRRHKMVLAVFGIAIAYMIFGVIQQGWWINEVAGLFFVLTWAAGLTYGYSLSETAEEFVKGLEFIAFAAVIVGVARSIAVVMEQGMIMDTVVRGLVTPLVGMPDIVAAALFVPVQTVINFFIPSGSGQALVTTPITAPMADIIGIPRQVIVLAYQYGDGFSNMFLPTLGATMGMISVADVPYDRWIAFAWKILLLQLIVGIISVSLAVVIGLGP